MLGQGVGFVNQLLIKNRLINRQLTLLAESARVISQSRHRSQGRRSYSALGRSLPKIETRSPYRLSGQ